jgi:hypothetical protein
LGDLKDDMVEMLLQNCTQVIQNYLILDQRLILITLWFRRGSN